MNSTPSIPLHLQRPPASRSSAGQFRISISRLIAGFFLGVCLSCPCTTSAAPPAGAYTPKVGSPERQAIMDFLRIDFYRDPKLAAANPRQILFTVHHLRVQNGWACVGVTPKEKGRELRDPSWHILRSEGGQWRQVDHMKKLEPFSHESEAMDARDLMPVAVVRLRKLVPEWADILPDAKP